MNKFRPVTHFDLLRDALYDYEYQRGRDVVLFPWRMLRWWLAWLWTQVWGWWRILRGSDPAWAFMWGRHESPEPIMCRYCLWAGSRRECYHGYAPCGDDDCEAMDSCPRCGGDML